MTGATGATGGAFIIGNMIINYGEAVGAAPPGTTATFKIPYVDNPPFVTLGGVTGTIANPTWLGTIKSVSKTGVQIEVSTSTTSSQVHYIAIGT